jgi:hypothetical protein
MTEAEWAACTEPYPMLAFLRGRASYRKLRLFAVACCRRVWHLLPQGRDEYNHAAVEAAERFADGRASRKELDDLAPLFTRWHYRNDPLFSPPQDAAFRTWHVISADAVEAALVTAFEAAKGTGEAAAAERAAQAGLLRDIFGPLPFRPVTVHPHVLAWSDRIVPRLAQAIYDERRWGNMSFLSEALLDAGCDDDEVLTHCRAGGEHVRGCWVVDLLLGKE